MLTRADGRVAVLSRLLASDRPSFMDTTAPGLTTSAPPDRDHLHAALPLTPSAVFDGRRGLLVGLGVLFAVLAVAAAARGGQLLLTWDEPIQRWVETNRTSTLDSFFRSMSRMGSTIPVLSLGVLGVAVTWRRCHAVAIALLVATFSRPLLEFVVKAVVGRERPDLERMVPGNGPSFPTGHVMAAVALWGLLPVVVALYTRRRSLWWASVGVSAVLVAGIGASRVYLGVHWFSDVVGGLVAGAFFLLGIEAVLARQHERRPCRLLTRCSRAGQPASRSATASTAMT